MEQYKDISFEVDEEFSKIYITGHARVLEKIVLGIRDALNYGRTDNRMYNHLFQKVEMYQDGKIDESTLERLLELNKEIRLGSQIITIETDKSDAITGNINEVFLEYGCSGSDKHFPEIMDTFSKVLRRYE